MKNNRKHIFSRDAGTGEILSEYPCASSENVDTAVEQARDAFLSWSQVSIADRINILRKFQAQVTRTAESLATIISQETGKPLWESKTEVASVVKKIDFSIAAHAERCSEKKEAMGPDKWGITLYRPHGVLGVFGPYNFPMHLPNGHIAPALLAGNTVIFKPSELTPRSAHEIAILWQLAGLPKGVMQVIQGGPDVGKNLAQHPGLDGLLFTGSSTTGKTIAQHFSAQPGKILALEMGGNNPLILSEVHNTPAAVWCIIQSAFLSSGQRCSCSRRLIAIDRPKNRDILRQLVDTSKQLVVGHFSERPEPFMGPVISQTQAKKITTYYEKLLNSGGASLLPLSRQANSGYLSPRIVDVTAARDRTDDEFFGPLLQVIWVPDFRSAVVEANNTRFGLSAGLLSDSASEFSDFSRQVRAGVINWNCPTTGASGQAPFGGLKDSGNHRPSAYFAADYCAYPIAMTLANKLHLPADLPPGFPKL